MHTSEQPPTNDPFSTIALIERDPNGQERRGRLQWWYRIAAPPAPTVATSLRGREAYRRGRYISNTLLAMIAIIVVVTVVIGGFVNHNLLPNLLLTLLFLCSGAFFNKRGQVIVSGIIVVLVLDVSIMAIFLSNGGMLTALTLPQLDLLVLPELFAASLLPPRFVFLDMLIHIIYYVCAFMFFPKDASLIAALHNPGTFADALMKPVVIQVITAVIAYTWMISVTHSVDRADRATSIAVLERDVAEQAQIEAEQKRQLDSEIREIIEVHTQIANGNFEARAPLRQGSALWLVAGSLNNLTARLKGLLRDSQRLKRTDEAVSRFFRARSEAQNGPIPWRPTGTPIDVLVQQHNTFVQQGTMFPAISQKDQKHL
jgi:hypothetical protein